MTDFLSDGSEIERAINNTHKIILSLKNEYYKFLKPRVKADDYGGYRPTLPIIPEAQILFESTNKKSVRGELEILLRKKIIRQFYVDLPDFPSERFFMLFHDYIDQFKSVGSQLATDFADKVLEKHLKFIISETELKKFGFNDENIREMVQMHILYITENHSYHIGLPNGTPFTMSVNSGRREIISYLKRCPNAKKMSVLSRNINDSLYYGEFHFKSLLGIGVISLQQARSPLDDKVSLVYDPYSKK
ncbi:hypothetical protein TVAG_490100 [Trichomonas vaginalis G3]|uniref:Uncharacterized protein n=1 Tax=Trichomonas vaginalis (strain ATCC PRA-98 / G3) TaxID=412133 RepID=A2FB47_TRIV3|nr:serine/threonine-protein kinase 19 family [Trichomonas vaginalis G3]EAX97882.1 hypothetical protein TVAG_490100 [Trichomonas vaginalis G3]KAI5501161.1 serine/threonine-protein kinase 19 family [Trichomonas vaginalis G3]|eukprot:XP_001310812.1 hypothetical protein [Trichomonas vaginalis G3]